MGGVSLNEDPSDYMAKMTHRFKFNAEKIRTVPQLLGGFEARTNIYDK